MYKGNGANIIRAMVFRQVSLLLVDLVDIVAQKDVHQRDLVVGGLSA